MYGENADAVNAARQKAVTRFCQQAVQAMGEAVRGGWKSADKFANPELDVVRRSPGYKDALPAGW